MVVVLVVTLLTLSPVVMTWLLMLFLGNVGLTTLGFWACLPGGLILAALLGTSAK